MPTTPNMSMVLPTDHSDADIWGALINTALTLNDLHDHTTGKGVPVPVAALKVNSDVAWSFAGTFYALTGVKALDFEPRPASEMTGYASALFANSSDSNNLYYRNQAGTNVQITDGSTLNVAGFVGGIGGDYSSIGALLDYDDASDTYRFRQETSASVRQFAKVKFADIQLIEYDAAGDASVPTNFVTLKSPDTLAASYTVTMPTALPASSSVVQMSSTGVLSAPVTLTAVASLLLTGVITPATLATSTNDYAPTGFADAFWVRVAADLAGSTLTGLAGGANGRVILLTNTQVINGTSNLTLSNENASSTAANRFTWSTNLVVGAQESVLLFYDGTTARWRPLAI